MSHREVALTKSTFHPQPRRKLCWRGRRCKNNKKLLPLSWFQPWRAFRVKVLTWEGKNWLNAILPVFLNLKVCVVSVSNEKATSTMIFRYWDVPEIAHQVTAWTGLLEMKGRGYDLTCPQEVPSPLNQQASFPSSLALAGLPVWHYSWNWASWHENFRNHSITSSSGVFVKNDPTFPLKHYTWSTIQYIVVIMH